MMILSIETATVITSVVIFLLVIILLVALLLYAKKKLMPSGVVKIDINDGYRVVETEPGSSLLSTLSNNKIILPSACGGGGTCGMCRCQVIEGGGSILPTETGFFSRKEQADNWRLGCQVKVKENMRIHMHQEILGVKKWECEVVSNRNVATFIKEFVVKLPEGENLDFKSGGYIQIDVPKYSASFRDFIIEDQFHCDWDKFKVWDFSIKNTEETFRAYSMANYPAEKNLIKLNIRIATPPWDNVKKQYLNVPPGICSSYIFSRKPGDKVTISDDAIVCGNASVNGLAEISGDAIVKELSDYIVFKNSWSSGRHFTWTKSNDMWRVGCFYGTGEELIKKAYIDSKIKGKSYEIYTKLVKELSK